MNIIRSCYVKKLQEGKRQDQDQGPGPGRRIALLGIIGRIATVAIGAGRKRIDIDIMNDLKDIVLVVLAQDHGPDHQEQEGVDHLLLLHYLRLTRDLVPKRPSPSHGKEEVMPDLLWTSTFRRTMTHA